MNTATLNQRDIDFLLYEFLDTESLLSRVRYAEHSRESFDATINGAKNIAEKYYANHYHKGDFAEAESLYRKCLEICPKNVNCKNPLGFYVVTLIHAS